MFLKYLAIVLHLFLILRVLETSLLRQYLQSYLQAYFVYVHQKMYFCMHIYANHPNIVLPYLQRNTETKYHLDHHCSHVFDVSPNYASVTQTFSVCILGQEKRRSKCL